MYYVFNNDQRKGIECFHHKEVVHVREDRCSFPDLNIIHNPHMETSHDNL
jgi:hypothetical protein